MTVVSAVILVVLAVIGAAAVVKEISLRLFAGSCHSSILLITPLNGEEDAEMALRSALSGVRWGRQSGVRAVCVDCGMDESTRRVCESVCRDYGFAALVSKQELLDRIGSD